MAEKSNAPTPGDNIVEAQAREQTGQRQVRIRMDERDMKTSYANAFRTNGTAEEVMLDFGLNLVVPSGHTELLFRQAASHYAQPVDPPPRGAVRRVGAGRSQATQGRRIVSFR